MNLQELNERIAVEVMGLSFVDFEKRYVSQTDGDALPLPDYSGDIAAAWLVVEELGKRKIIMELDFIGPNWNCVFYDTVHEGNGYDKPTAPLAICHAALDISAKLRALPSGGE